MSRYECERWRGRTDNGSGELDVEELDESRGVEGRVYEAGVVERGACHCGGEEEADMTSLRRGCYKGEHGRAQGPNRKMTKREGRGLAMEF